MSDYVSVPIPVTPEAVGKLISDILRPSTPETDPLAAMIAEVKADARADGLTDEQIDAELAAYNAERRF
jgi:hypothetical protein